MKAAIYPGSFDPITNGHLDIIKRTAFFCDHLIVGVFINPDKTALFSVEERIDFIKDACRNMPHVSVVRFSGLVSDFARERQIGIIIRGVRGNGDLDNEIAMARTNRQLYAQLDTVLLPASAAYEHVSASIVRQVAYFHGDVTEFVPARVAQALRQRFQ